VAELRHRLRALEEVPDDPLAIGIVAMYSGARPPGITSAA